MLQQHQYRLTVKTPGRDIIDITDEIANTVAKSSVTTGLCHIFIHHTSASLILCENADPQVLQDLEAFTKRFIPDGDPIYRHTAEGADDMPAHVRSVFTTSFLQVPITNKALALGTWQGIYLWEHRIRSYQRHLTITIQGD